MGAIVQFSWAAFIATFPELQGIGPQMAAQFFQTAENIHRNDGGGPIGDPVRQLNLMNMVVAHLAQMYAPRDAKGLPALSGSPAPALTGRISSASEGSVSVQTEALSAFKTEQAQWFATSRYGQLYWVSTAFARTMRYRPFWDVRKAVR